ncbi:hypothetical protein [Tardiphaga sp.]|uniref:hypothetical protein n=1 Tax=Tardiphaga sp. TaxID=1926292 RepID=UPI00261F10EF|nr:hypothetical protein [Tardiphaga sp.]MDB5619106.1 hypothetical protein [Tardiphaga sp.]
MTPTLVLTTVNAPYRRQLDADELAHCLRDPVAANALPGHMSSFFGEVAPALQIAFAAQFGIAKPQLVAAARAFAAYSGETYPLATIAAPRSNHATSLILRLPANNTRTQWFAPCARIARKSNERFKH